MPSEKSAQEQLAAIKDLARALGHAVDAMGPLHAMPASDAETARLRARLAQVEADERDLAERLVAAEAQVQKLTRLYVATDRLHGTLSPAGVTDAICEIAVDLLGAERFVLLRADEHSTRYLISAAEGISVDDFPFYGAAHFAGGEPLTDAALATGEVQLGQEPGAPSVVIPLTAEGERIGAIVVLKMFEHRGALGAADYDLVELLAAHAASALFAAMLHHTATRKLHTLESVVELARGGAIPSFDRKAAQ